MATSGSVNYTVTRDDVIKRALRIVGAIGQGETPQTTAVTEAAQALNELVKEWIADGLQLWKYSTTFAITMVAGTSSYNIGTGATVNQIAPVKVLDAYLRNTSTNTDTPLLLVTNQEYTLLGNKASQGRPTQLLYAPPRVPANEPTGIIVLYPTPDAATVAAYQLYMVGTYPIYDFDASSDTADFPNFYFNALAWGLADQLAYEYGLPYAERSMITKKAETHLAKALGFDREEGSIYLQPNWEGGW